MISDLFKYSLLIFLFLGGLAAGIWLGKTSIPPKSKAQQSQYWVYYNETYNQGRNFRFRYPSELQIHDIDSGKVWLKRNENDPNLGEIGLEEIFPFTEFQIGNPTSQDDKFRKFYVDLKSMYGDTINGGSIHFTRIDLTQGVFFYKVFEKGVEHSLDRYIGIVQGKGIELIDYQQIPEQVVLGILRSIEFQSD